MMVFIFTIAILNLGLGFALAVYLGWHERTAQTADVDEMNLSDMEIVGEPIRIDSEITVPDAEPGSQFNADLTTKTTKTPTAGIATLPEEHSDSNVAGELASY
jgi:hypothetical protein